MAIILPFDLGKFNSVLCGFDDATGEVEFRRTKATPAILRKELTRRPIDLVMIKSWLPEVCVTPPCQRRPWREIEVE